MAETGSVATRKHLCPFCEIQSRVPRKLPGCQALRRQHAPCATFAVSAYCSRRSLLGTHRKKSFVRKHLLPTAAVPALAGMAAAVCLAPQAQAEPVPAHAAAHTAVTAEPATVTDATRYAGISPAQLLAAVRQASRQSQDAAKTA